VSETARDRILARLRNAPDREETPPPAPEPPPATAPGRERIERLKALLTAMRAEVRLVSADGWLPDVIEMLRARGTATLLYAPETPIGRALESAREAGGDPMPELVPYAAAAESLKDRIFEVDAAITTAAGAVADTGAIVLRPSTAEPRLMSLVPPLHVAVLRADTVYGSLTEAMQAGGWAEDMPSNLVLVSGPSKTADIELVLAFGVHGPKELVVMMVE
jgi:L-lactate dehydrogenase complex protein LldG